ncbi:unnamed protein product [Camellia sinensis]
MWTARSLSLSLSLSNTSNSSDSSQNINRSISQRIALSQALSQRIDRSNLGDSSQNDISAISILISKRALSRFRRSLSRLRRSICYAEIKALREGRKVFYCQKLQS